MGAGITSLQPVDPEADRFQREAARTRAGDLFAEHATLIRRICTHLLRDDFEAEDAAQQTFLSAYKALLTGAEPRDGEAWLATIARNECLHRIRARMRRPLPVLEHELEDRRRDVHRLALDRLNAAQLWREISRLPPQQRDAVILREVAGLSYDELALLLGVTRPGVESLLFRARGQLRTRLRAALASVNLAGLASEAGAALARLAGQGVAAPLAVKAAAVGVGAAVVGGGGLVAEQRLEPSERVDMPAVAAAAPARHVPHAARHGTPVVLPAVPLVVADTAREQDGRGPGPRAHDVRPEQREQEGRDRGHDAVTSIAEEPLPQHEDRGGGGDGRGDVTTVPAAALLPVPTTTTSSGGGDGPSGGSDGRTATTAALATTDGHDGGATSTTDGDGGSGPDGGASGSH